MNSVHTDAWPSYGQRSTDRRDSTPLSRGRSSLTKRSHGARLSKRCVDFARNRATVYSFEELQPLYSTHRTPATRWSKSLSPVLLCSDTNSLFGHSEQPGTSTPIRTLMITTTTGLSDSWVFVPLRFSVRLSFSFQLLPGHFINQCRIDPEPLLPCFRPCSRPLSRMLARCISCTCTVCTLGCPSGEIRRK